MGRQERKELRAAYDEHRNAKPGTKGHDAAHARAVKAQGKASMAEVMGEAFLANFRTK